MNAGKYILVNGSFVPANEYRLTIQEAEGFLFSEKFRAVRTAFPFFRETLEMIKLKLLLFNQSYPDFTNHDGSGLKRQLERSLTKNKLFMGAVLTLTFRRAEGKMYYSIQSKKLEDTDYILNEKGWYIAIFDKIQKPASSLSNLSVGSEIYWNIAKSHLNNLMTDQVLLINPDDQILEVPGANLYTIKGKTVKSCGSRQGAYMDISRQLMLDIFKQARLEYREESLTEQDIRDAEEIMLVNAIDGIRWVVGFEEKRYFNNTIRRITDLFNHSLFS